MELWDKCQSVERDENRVSGSWLFTGTRIPVSALFENLEDGATISEFVEWFPGVKERQAKDVLEHALKSLEAA